MVSKLEPSIVPSNTTSYFEGTHDRALERTAILARHLFPIGDSIFDPLQAVPVIGGPTPQQNQKNTSKAPSSAPKTPPKSSAAPKHSQPSKAPSAPAKSQPRPNPAPQKAAPPPQKHVAPPNPPRPVAQIAPTPKHVQLTQQIQRAQENSAAIGKLLSSTAASMPQTSSQVPIRAPTLTPPTPVTNFQKPPQQHLSNPAASAPKPNPPTPVPSFKPPSSTDHTLNSRLQPHQIPTPSASAPKQISSLPQVPPSSVPKASPIPQNSFAAESLKPFGPIEPQQSSDPAAITPPRTDPIMPIDLNAKVNTSTTPTTLFTKMEGDLPPTAGPVQTLTPPPSYSPSSVTGVDLKVDEQGFLARSKAASASIKNPSAANLTPLVPTSLVPDMSPIGQKALETAAINNPTTIARTSNIVNQLMDVPSVPHASTQAPVTPVKNGSGIDFTKGFFKGLKNGAKDSATEFFPGMFAAIKAVGEFTYETITRPVEHTKEVYAALEETVQYIKTHEMREIGQKLAPEVHKLVTEWDTLPSGEKGELTGYCLGKYGADFVIMGGVLKGAKAATAVVRTEVAVGAALKEAVAVSNAGKAIAGGLEAQVLAKEANAAARVVGTVERSAVEARAGSAAVQALGKEVKLGGQQVQIAKQTEKLLSANEAIVSATQGAALAEAEVIQLEKTISNWLGEGAKLIRNEAGDSVFLSKDGSRCVRFDFNKTKPHNNLHAHVEIKVDGKWVKSGQIYPTDVPHN